jgi:apolipoprotein N-acyltransferase
MLDESTLTRILEALPRLSIAVVGDLFLDKYLDLDSGLTETSVETGLDAFQVVGVRCYPGAGGTVLNNLKALGVGHLHAVSVIGSDGGLLGVPVRSAAGDYLNSVKSLGASPTASYDKVHLVPFGEFVPPGFGWIVRVLSIPLADFARGATDQRPMAIAGQRIAVNVCYEDAYGAEIIRQLPEATLLVNVSNVAWFGDSLAPAQHLQIARMRALETGRVYLTAANTGITAAIWPDASVRQQMKQFVQGRIEFEVRGYSGATPYVRFGDWPAVVLALLALAFVALRGRSR